MVCLPSVSMLTWSGHSWIISWYALCAGRVGVTSASALVAGCLEIWARQLIRAFSFSDHLCASVPIHPTELPFLMLIVSVVVVVGVVFVS